MDIKDYIDIKMNGKEKAHLHILEILNILKDDEELMNKYYIYGPNGMEDLRNPTHLNLVNHLIILQKRD